MTDRIPPAKVLVILPTYNEAENIEPMIEALYGLDIEGLQVLVVDDQSPDGTAERVRRLGAKHPGLRLVVRSGEPGRGLAGRDGFLYALEHGAEYIVEMDADFSHQPRHLRPLLLALRDADMAIGSRRAPGGSDEDRAVGRRFLTLLANVYARTLLRLPVLDTNSGYRAYTRRALEAIEPATLASKGPSIIHEVLHRAVRAGLAVREVPIRFLDRKAGVSKLNLAILALGYFWILRLFASMLASRRKP